MTRKQTFTTALAALCLLGVGQAVQAQSDLRIGYVNMQALIQNAPQIATINRQLQDEFAERQTNLESMQEELQEKVDNYTRDRDVMAAAERTALERELTQMQRDLERRANELQEDVQIRQQELVNALQVEIVQKVQSYVRDQGYDLVVTDAIYVGEGIDITAAAYEAIGGRLQPAASGDE